MVQKLWQMLKFSGMYVKGHGQGNKFWYNQNGHITRNDMWNMRKTYL